MALDLSMLSPPNTPPTRECYLDKVSSKQLVEQIELDVV